MKIKNRCEGIKYGVHYVGISKEKEKMEDFFIARESF
jgi:hypothetical protein